MLLTVPRNLGEYDDDEYPYTPVKGWRWAPDPDDAKAAVKALGYCAEHITEPSEIVPALKRAFDENACNRPAYLEFICSQYPVYGAWVTTGRAAH